MSLNKITSDTPIKNWLNIGANSIRCNSINIVNGLSGDLLPSTNLTWDVGSHALNWRAVYTGVVKDLIAPVEAQDAINYVSAQILTTENSGLLTETVTGNTFTYTGINPAQTEYIFGGIGSAGLYGLGNLPAQNLSCYEFQYNFNTSGMSSTFIGYPKIFIGSGAVPVAQSTLVTNNNSVININGVFQIMSGFGTNQTIVNTTINIYCVVGGTPQIQTNNYQYLTADTSSNCNFVFKMAGTNAVGQATLVRMVGYVRNIYQPSAFP